MRQPIKAVAYGCGRMGRLGIQYMYKRGVKIVGAIDTNPALEGVDVGEYCDLGVSLGVKIRSDADAVLDECKPDIVVASLFSFVSECEPHFNKVLSRGIDLITTCDESHFAWNTSPEVMNRLDKLARDNNCTITGSGLQDIFWMNIVACVAGGMHELNIIEGVTTFNTDEYGPALAKAYNIGCTKTEFDTALEADGQPDAFLMRATNDAICSKLGLIPISYKQETLPYVSDKAVYSSVLGREIPAGDCIGTQEIVTTYTKQGITIKTSDIGYVFSEGDGDSCNWKLYGGPDVEFNIPNINSYEFTMGSLVNRIPDVINADPGYQTNSTLGMTKYMAYPMEFYVKERT